MDLQCSTLSPSSSPSSEPIAIVGLGCRFPGNANSPQAFWELLLNGTDTVGEIPAERWDLRRYYHPDPSQPGKMCTRHASLLKQIDQFDASFFDIPPVEATRMDPQQRLLLEVAWEGLEDAGLVPQQLAGSQTGVFVGICSSDYSVLQRQDPTAINPYSGAGDALSIAANRISYLFDFHGPSFSVDTACSSSLVAVHLACESLRRGECGLALAAGTTILLDPNLSIKFSKAGILSPNGHCRTFDASADGFVRGEGVGVVVLKPLSQALTEGNPIYAVIRSTAINQDGRTPNLHYPSQQAQVALLRQIYAQAGISPHQVHYIEAHGTGTISGDFVECSALGEVFAAGRSQEKPLRIGSVKTAIGHLEGASGIAGLIKAALLLKHRQIPANLHFQTPNPQIAFEQLRLQVQTTTETLPPSDDSYIVGINSFGFGGTNAHVILQEYAASTPAGLATVSFGEDQSFLLPLSARSPQALRALAQAFLAFLDNPIAPSLRDLCFSTSLHREHHPYRLALTVTSLDNLKEKLQVFLSFSPLRGITLQGVALGCALKNNAKRLAFVFSGNGPQWFAMGRHLLIRHALFRSVIERCDQHWFRLTGWSLIEELLADEACSRIDRTEVAQPTLFALQVALSELWKSLGIEPQAVIGHSVGEIAAAYVAGILSLEDAIQVVYHRSRLQELTVGQGMMAAVGISVEKAHELIAPYEPRVSLASINSPQSVTLSGEKAALEEIIASLIEQGIFCRFLKLNYAFHHGTLDPLCEEFLQSSQNLQPQEGHISFISTVTGAPLYGNNCDAVYWWQNLRSPVQFAPGIQHLLDNGFVTFVEIGPHPVLSGYIAECLTDQQAIILPSLRRKEDDQQILLGSLASLYTLGFPIAWEHLVAGGQYIKLPTYPWQHEHFWNEPEASSQGMQGNTIHPLLGYRLAAALPLWENHLGNHDLLYLRDHQIDGVVLFPATGYYELFLAAAGDHFKDGAYELAQIQIQRPLFFSDGQQFTLQTILQPEDGNIEALGHTSDGWFTCASAQLTSLSLSAPAAVDVHALCARCQHELAAPDFYQECHRRGYHYGPAFQLVEHISFSEQEALGMIRLPENAQDYLLHPAFLDCCNQVLLALIMQHSAQTFLPVSIERFRCYVQALPLGPLYSYVRLVTQGTYSLTSNCVLLDSQGQVLVEITGVRLEATSLSDQNASLALDEHIYEEAWVPAPLSSQKHGTGRLPSAAALATQTHPGIEQICRAFPTDRYYQRTLPFTNRLCLAYILTTLRQLGWDVQMGEHVTVPQLLSRLHILPRHERLLHAWCLVLAEENILSPSQEGWIVMHTPEDMNLPELLLTGLTDYPENHLGLLLLMRCGHQLTEILTGAIDPLSVLFPDGDATLLEHLYTNEFLLRRSNSIAQEMLNQLVSQLPEGQTLRILEIGAGTGGTTSYLLPILPADRSTYVFTDLSKAFLQGAEQKYQAYPFVSYQILDLERDPLTQGFDEHSFDLVIASNVIHATSNIRQSLHSIYQLLAPEGMFCLIEVTHPLGYIDKLTLGLLEGFWLFQDTNLRPCLPFLTNQQWHDVLSASGFTSVTELSPHPETDQPEQTVFLAQKPPLVQEMWPIATSLANYLIFADDMGLAATMQAQLHATSAILVQKGEQFQQLSPDHFLLRPRSREDLYTLFEILESTGGYPKHIVYLWGLDNPAGEVASSLLKEAVDTACLSLLFLGQALLQTSSNVSHLWIITSGTQPLFSQNVAPSIVQAPLYGLSRVLASEHPELHSTLITLSAPEAGIYSSTEIRALCDELQTQANDAEILLHDSSRFVNRIVRSPLHQRLRTDRVLTDPSMSFHLETIASGTLDTLQFSTRARRRPGPGEVEIAIAATSLNFRDVALLMGLIPADPDYGNEEIILGTECAGTIASVGEGVTDLQVGDEVIACAANCFAPFVTTDARLVTCKPTPWSMEEAATVMTVFLTAYYALHWLAHLRKGERVLIHSAAGGVGLAAIQIVQAAGGEIFATAGSLEKRAYLHALGVQHVLDSRSLSFADEIMRLTNGEGVDIILNSLSGAAAAKSLSVLRSFGRFLEIGKRDFFENKKLSLRPFGRCLSYFGIDLARMMIEDRETVSILLHELVGHFEQGIYHPLPYEVFQLAQIQDALRYMQQSRHIGKLVVNLQYQYAPVLHKSVTQPLALRPDVSYLVTGGLGGFGLATAEWLAIHGARYLVLASRRGKPLPEDLPAIEALQAAGVHLLMEAVDVAEEDAVKALLDKIRMTFPPLRGLFHAAMVLDDRPFSQLDEAAWTKALAPKMLGAWNLHLHTRHLPLDFFVLYSSASSLVGNQGQGNYVAGNLFLEKLAHYRRTQGLSAFTIGWGALKEVGYVARNAATLRHLDLIGFQAMQPQQALDLLGCLIQGTREHVCISIFNWERLDATCLSSPLRSRWSHLLPRVQEGSGGTYATALVEMTPEEEGPDSLSTSFLQKLAQVLGRSPGDIDPQQSLTDLGLDSLLAMELRSRVMRDLNIDIPTMQLLRPQSVTDLVSWMRRQFSSKGSSRQATRNVLTPSTKELVFKH